MRKNKAQSSLEFLVTMSFILILLIILGYVIHEKYAKTNDLKLHIVGMRVSKTIADNMNEISSVGDGYSQYFTFPARLYGNNYTLRFYSQEAGVTVDSKMTWWAPLFTTKINCGMKECDGMCNKTGREVCMQVNERITAKIVNRGGNVLLGDFYLWTEAEQFDNLGNWNITGIAPLASNNHFLEGDDAIGADANTTVSLHISCNYILWVRSYDDSDTNDRNFNVSVDGIMSSETFGDHNTSSYYWENGGLFDLNKGDIIIKLVDTVNSATTADADAVLLTTDLVYDPNTEYTIDYGKPPDAREK